MSLLGSIKRFFKEPEKEVTPLRLKEVRKLVDMYKATYRLYLFNGDFFDFHVSDELKTYNWSFDTRPYDRRGYHTCVNPLQLEKYTVIKSISNIHRCDTPLPRGNGILTIGETTFNLSDVYKVEEIEKIPISVETVNYEIEE